MCGICGIVSATPLTEEEVLLCASKLHHRGPDATGSYLHPSGKVALGHTRLSILDLADRANQPMFSADGSLVIIFNGEIYNFLKIKNELIRINPSIRFATTSDTEVILHAFQQWGNEMANKLEGMFAIAIFDLKTETLWLFRDRLGKKPIFYFWNKECFAFASELKALLQLPVVKNSLEVDTQAIHEFLHLGYIPEPKTIFRSIRKFPAASVGKVTSTQSFSVKAYWKMDTFLNQPRLSGSDSILKSNFKSILTNAVEARLISDVPLGCFLSGGTDSSLITAVASEITTTPVKTFSIGFKESKFDEHKFAASVSRELKTHHYEYVLSESEAAGMLEGYLYQMDEPFADTSTIPTMLVSKLARKEVTVALTGDGGDELFLGYGSYHWANRLKNPFFKPVQPFVYNILKHSDRSRLKRVSHLVKPVTSDKLRSHIFSQEQYFFSDKELQLDLLANTINYQPFTYSDPSYTNGLSPAEKQAIFDLQFYLKDDLLAKVDRASMAFSLECRAPLLDQHVMEFALQAPLRLKRRDGVDKWLLKEALCDYLPKNLVYRKKWGFSIPLSRWLKHEFRYMITDNLNEEVVRSIALVNYSYVQKLIDSFMGGHDYLYNRIWVLAIIHKWLKENSFEGKFRS